MHEALYNLANAMKERMFGKATITLPRNDFEYLWRELNRISPNMYRDMPAEFEVCGIAIRPSEEPRVYYGSASISGAQGRRR